MNPKKYIGLLIHHIVKKIKNSYFKSLNLSEFAIYIHSHACLWSEIP